MKHILAIFVISTLFSHTVLAETAATYTLNKELSNVHNRCIVSFHDDLESVKVKGLAKAMSVQANASLKHIYQHSIKGFTINIPCFAAYTVFGDDSAISSMEPDGIISINKGKPVKDGGDTNSPKQEISYGTERIGGGGVVVDIDDYTAWVIDSGIDLKHPDLNIDESNGFSVFKNRKTGEDDMDDQNGHGTHVAGIIGAIDNTTGSLGVAPGVTVIPVRVLDRRGSGSYSGVIAGIDHVAENASAGDCVNLSLGGGVSQTLDDAVIAASNKSGAFFVLAAGNDGDDANNHSPARANGENIWTISAIDQNDSMPSWSNYGNPTVDFSAPGVNIISLWKDGGTNTISGTSMAAPHACAVIMLSHGNPSFDGTAMNDPDNFADPIVFYSPL
ncbi:MAG: S8 family peptidase [gamma proteobacterium symbiont of Taylorina sp.]|nr:S8 family peptidase [gamma proteobacterium symbiont of Taylorina sp.]